MTERNDRARDAGYRFGYRVVGPVILGLFLVGLVLLVVGIAGKVGLL